MPYAYYARLSRADKSIYRQSDSHEAIELGAASRLRSSVRRLRRSLRREDRIGVETDARALCNALCADLGARPPIVKLLAVRPSHDWGELHGLYEPADGRRRARITVWMRTARHRRVVAFRTFLRTFLHELCHHLDYEVLGLADSFHTEGFFKRESSLFRQLVGEASNGPRRKATA